MTIKIITFSGVDGAGKSTLIEYVDKELKSKGFHVIKKRSRPEILPILSTFKYGKKSAESRATIALPRLGGNTSRFTSFLRFAYYFLDYFLGQIFIRIIYRSHKDIVIYDRYYFDYIIDPIRANILLSKNFIKFFYRFIDKPDLNIFLFAPTDEIFKRKNELDKNTINTLTKNYKKLFTNLDKSRKEKYLIIENISLEKSSSAIIEHINEIL